MIRRSGRWTTLVVVLLALSGCREERPTGITPIEPMASRRAPVAEEPSPLIVHPHLRRTEGGHVEPTPPRTGGGGGGGADWQPRPAPEPSAREVEAFRRELDEELTARVDPTESPCDQFLDVMHATAEAGGRPGQQTPELPSREAMRENCRELPPAYRQCLSPQYFREHLDECNEQMARMARRGERQSDQARRRFEDMRSGRAAWPGQQDDVDRRPRVDSDEDELPED